MNLTLVTAPTSEPVTLEETKAWLRLDTTDADTQIKHLITAARMSAEEYLRRALMTQTWKLTLDLTCNDLDLGDGVYDLPVTALYGDLPSSIPLPKGPVSAISSVTTTDINDSSTTFASSNYYLADDRLNLTYGAIWPTNIRPRAGCDIQYVAGYGTALQVPQPIKTGIMIHVAALYEQRGMCDDPSGIPATARQLYNQYRVMGSRV